MSEMLNLAQDTTKRLLLKAVTGDQEIGKSFKQYKPATYTVTLSTEYKPSISLLVSSLDFVLSVSNDVKLEPGFDQNRFSENPQDYMDLLKDENNKNKVFTRYYHFTKKLQEYLTNAVNDNKKEATIPITGEEYMIAKTIMISNLIAMQHMSQQTDVAAKNPNYAKTLADYATVVDAFIKDRDIEVQSNDMLIISYSLYYNISKQWQNQADEKQNFSWLKPEEAMGSFSKEDIENFMKTFQNNPINL